MAKDAKLQTLIAKYRRYPDFAELDLSDINRQCCPGDDTLLHLVTRQGSIDEIGLLVACGADVNAKGDIGRTPLSYAASRGRLDVVTKLLELGADQSLPDEFGDMPLSWAQRADHMEAVRLLRQAERKRRLSGRANTNA